jgi:hypothetical protein
VIDLNKPLEGLDYEVNRVPGHDNEQAWMVRILRGEFKDVLMGFTNVEYNGTSNSLRFKYSAAMVLNDSADTNVYVLDTSDIKLQDLAFDVLQDVIKNGIANGSIVFDDKDTDDRNVG